MQYLIALFNIIDCDTNTRYIYTIKLKNRLFKVFESLRLPTFLKNLILFLNYNTYILLLLSK